MRQLKLLLVTNLYPTPVEGTRGIFVHQLAKRLRALCEVTVVCPLPWFPAVPLPGLAARWRAYSQVPASYSVEGIEVHSPKYPLLPRVSERFHASLMRSTLAFAIRRLHGQKRFDVLNAQWLYPDGVAATAIARGIGLPVVLSALGSDVNVFLREPAKWRQIAHSLAEADAITTVSQALKDRLVAEGADGAKITVVPNGADPGLFSLRAKHDVRGKLGMDPATKAILFVGRLVEIKGVEHLIAAAARLAQKRSDFTVYLLGDGDLREPLLADARARGLGERLKWMGPKPHDEIPLWMSACDVFCLPSLNEGWPNVVLEALFAGRPVVASRTGGIPEMVDASNGYLPDPGDAIGLAGALDSALDASWDANAIRAGVQRFTWEAAAERYHSVFESVSRARRD